MLNHLLFSVLAQNNGGAGAAAGGGLLVLVEVVLIVVVIAGLWKVFTKAGKPGWAAIVPIYNIIVLLDIVNRPIWWFILFLIPFVNLIVGIMVYNDLSGAFGKGIGYTIGMLFLPFIFIPMLGFGDAVYTKPKRA